MMDTIRRGVASARFRLSTAARAFVESVVLAPRLSVDVRHVHGPQTIACGADELIVTCNVHAGDFYYRRFVEHHLQLGVRHVVLLVNGPADAAMDSVGNCPQVTVLATLKPYARYENVMRRYLLRRFSYGRWNLHLDIDELFDFPASNVLSLREFLRYLNDHRFSAVLGQMLDFYADEPLDALPDEATAPLHQLFPLCDLSGIRTDTEHWYRCPPGLSFHRGGLREQLFGVVNCLTKFPLLLVNDDYRIVTVHNVRNVRLADISCLISHFPFNAGFPAKVREAVSTGRYGPATTPEYHAYRDVLSRQRRPRITAAQPQRWSDVDDLVTRGFLVTSRDYREWVQCRSR